MTAASARILEALRIVTADGWPATVREVAAQAGRNSPGNTHRLLRILEAEGMVLRNPRNSHGGWMPS